MSDTDSTTTEQSLKCDNCVLVRQDDKTRATLARYREIRKKEDPSY